LTKGGILLFECSIEAEKAGRGKAIMPGEPADLVDRILSNSTSSLVETHSFQF
jgi:hypothetical protein